MDVVCDHHRLVERDEHESKTVVLICDLILRGWNLSTICRELEAKGVKSPSGGSKWWPDVVKRIALESFNAGLTKKPDCTLIQGQHWDLRYFEPEYHEKVADQVKKIGRVAPMTRTTKTHLLLPKLKCAHCGQRLYVDKREEHRHRVYWCKNHSVTRGKDCPGARAKIVWADSAVVELLKLLSNDGRIIAEAENVIARELSQDYGKLKQEKAKIERDMREDSEKLALAVEQLATGDIKKYSYDAYEAKVIAKAEERTVRLNEIEAALAASDVNKERIARTKTLLRDFEAIWANLIIDEQRKAIDLMIDDLQLSQTHLMIKPFFADMIQVPIPVGRFREGKPGDPRGLSRRELSILKMLGDGLTSKQIADRTGLALQTVYGHTSRIRAWFGLDDMESVIELARPVIERTDDLPTDMRLNVARQHSDQPTAKQLEVLQAVAAHTTQAKAYASLGIPYQSGAQRLRLLMKKTGVSSLQELYETAVSRGWMAAMPGVEA